MGAQIENHSMSMQEFRERLAGFPDDATVIFAVDGLPLHYYRAKIRGKDNGKMLLQLEFNECSEPEYWLQSSFRPVR